MRALSNRPRPGTLVAGLWAFVCVVLGAAPSAYACSVSVRDRAAELFDVFSASTDIFLGTVVRGRGFARDDVPSDLINARFRVIERFKGAQAAEIDDFANCGDLFNVGETYLVFGTTTAGTLHTRPGFITRVSRPANDSEREWAEQAIGHVRQRVADPTLAFLKVWVPDAFLAKPAVTVHVERVSEGRRADLTYTFYTDTFYRMLTPGRYTVHVRQGSPARILSTEVLLGNGESRSISIGPAGVQERPSP